MSRLEEHFRDALDARGLHIDEPTRRLAVDLTRLLIRASGATVQDRERQSLDAALAARTDLPAEARDALLALALSPRFRAAVSPADLLAFGARFGRDAHDRLAEEQAEELDLEGFAARYGTEASLLLMDGLFQVASADGHIEAREARVLETSAEALGVDGVLVSALFQKYDPRHAAGDLTWDLNKERITIGRAGGNDVVLPDPQVARHHCDLVRDPTGWRVVDAGSGRPVLVDGLPVIQAMLAPHNKIQLGPWRLQVVEEDGEWKVHAFGHRSFTSLSVGDVTRHIGDVCLLDEVRFTVFSGEVVALVGPSGAGKTTLINAISGVAPADRGAVLLNGRDFHAILQADRTAVGLVPQEDLVHPTLKVAESLRYAGKLRLPADVDLDELNGTVDRVLTELGIDHIRESQIGDATKRGISGGQRKRVNLAQELLTRSTRVLFLDEPTSGLDPRSAQDIARLVRQLADDGRIVFLVTHDLTPGIMAQCDHLLVLAPGGRVAWFGPPAEACRYFGVDSPDLIFSRLSEKTPEAWKAGYQESLQHRKYVATREHLLRPGEGTQGAEQIEDRSAGRPSQLSQFKTLTQRYFRRKMRDQTGMLVMVAQPLLLALTTWIVFPVPTDAMVFMFTLSCLWFGMSSAVREMISDRAIWRRERKVGVGVTPYVGSKTAVLGLLVTLECVAFTAMVYTMVGMQAGGYDFWALAGVASLTGLSGMTLGLLISSVMTSSEAAVGMLPLLLVPMICFSSIMVPLRHMEKPAQALSWIFIERYAFEAALKTGDELQKVARGDGKWERQPLNGTLYTLGLKSVDAEDMGLPMRFLIGVVVAFMLGCLALTWAMTWWRDRT